MPGIDGPPTDTLRCIAEAMIERKGADILSLEVGALPNAICQHFIICHADSTTQVGAIADHVQDMLAVKWRLRPWRTAGHENGIWIVLDYLDVVVHIFQTQCRAYYQLEALWADAPAERFTDRLALAQA